MRLALYQPDIPQNTGTILRLGACLGVAVDIIEPCGFLVDDRSLRRAAMDYAGQTTIRRHRSWQNFLTDRAPGRLILLTTRADVRHIDHAFAADDTLLLGRESAGVPTGVRAAADGSVRIPMVAGLRSLNVAVAASLVLGEALRQVAAWPGDTKTTN